MTLRARLTRMLLLVLAPLNLAAGVGLYAFMHASLVARLDESLGARAEALAAVVKSRDGELELDPEDAATPQYSAPPSAAPAQSAYFEVHRLSNGALAGVLQKSRSLGTRTLLPGQSVPDRERIWNSRLAGNTPVRVLARRVDPTIERDDPPRTPDGAPEQRRTDAPMSQRPSGVPQALLVVAVSRDAVDETLRVLAIAILAGGAAILVVGWLSLRWAIVRGLRPLGALTAQIEALDPTALDRPLSVPRLPRELAPIQDRTNALLERIDGAIRREKRFTTAAAHELRTPVAELRTLLEVAASRPRSVDESARTVSTALASVQRLDRLVAALIRLARIESGAEPPELQQVDLAPALAGSIQSAAPVATARGVRFHVDIPDGLTIHSEPALLGLALGNLIANAAEYADHGSEVAVTAAMTGPRVVLTIANQAASLSRSERERIGQPLWRADRARTFATHTASASSDAAPHLGLGITLARAALAAIDATFTLAAQPQDQTSIVARTVFPSSTPEPGVP